MRARTGTHSSRARSATPSGYSSLPTPLRREQLVFQPKRADFIDLAAWRRGPWKKALTAAGIEYRELYGMRDTFATLNLNDGAPLEWISEQMGHASIETTSRHYARWLPETDYRILDSVNKRRAAVTGLEADSTSEASGE